MKKTIFPAFVSLFLVTGTGAQDNNAFHILTRFSILSPGGWDYLAVGPGNGKLYISHGTQVNILDIKTGDSAGVIENTTGVHGIAFDKEHNRGFTSNGRLNNVTVFDLASNRVLAQVSTGQNPDAILYEPYSRKIITCNGRSKNLSIIDPVTCKLVDSIDVGGKPETAVSDETGMLYVNIEDKNEIVKVNMMTLKIENHWPLSPAEEPTGLALDRTSHRLFAGCSNRLLAILDSYTGKTIRNLPIGDGCDGVGFDNNAKTIFTSNGEGTLSVFREKSADDFEKVGDIATQRGARTLAIDPETHLIYLPAADFEPMDPAQKGRPKMIPGTFQVLVVGNK